MRLFRQSSKSRLERIFSSSLTSTSRRLSSRARRGVRRDTESETRETETRRTESARGRGRKETVITLSIVPSLVYDAAVWQCALHTHATPGDGLTARPVFCPVESAQSASRSRLRIREPLLREPTAAAHSSSFSPSSSSFSSKSERVLFSPTSPGAITPPYLDSLANSSSSPASNASGGAFG